MTKKTIFVGIMMVIAVLTGVSLAANNWTGAADPNDPNNAGRDWFLAGNWDAGTVVPPILGQGPLNFGTSAKLTPIVNIGSSLNPTVTANSGVFTMGTAANSNGTINVWPNATWNSALITGGTGTIYLCNQLNTTANVYVKNGTVWNVGQAAAGGIATNFNLANYAATAGNPTYAKITIEAGGRMNITGGTFMSSNADSATARPQGDMDIYGTLNTGSGTTIQMGRRGESTYTIFSGGLWTGAVAPEMQAGYTRIWIKDGGEYFSSSGALTMSRYRLSLNAANRNGEATIDCEGKFGLFGGHLQMSHTDGMSVVNVSGNGKMRIGHSTSARNIVFPYQVGADKCVVNVSGGRLTVAGQLTRVAGTLKTGLVRSFTMSGGETNIRTITGTTTEVGTLTHSGGVFSPAVYVQASDSYREVYKTDIASPYTQTSSNAVIQIDIAGKTANGGTVGTNDYDVIANTSTMTILGPLKVVFRDDFQMGIASTDTFNVITCSGSGTITGSFSNVVGGKVNAYLPDGSVDGQFTVTQTATSVVLSNYSSTNLAPVVTLTNAYTYLGAGSVNIVPVVTDENISSVTYLWSIVSQPVGSTCLISPSTTSRDVVVTTDTVGTYVLNLKATDSGGKYSNTPVSIYVAADACGAAKLKPGFALLNGDENADCKVDFTDLGLMAGNWLTCVSQVCP